MVDGKKLIRKDSLIVMRIVSGTGEEKTLKGTLQIGTMIPVPDDAIELYDVENEPDRAYKDLVNEEIIYIRKNQKKIMKNAKILYSKRKAGVGNKVVQSCLDFEALEKECDNWKNLNKQKVLDILVDRLNEAEVSVQKDGTISAEGLEAELQSSQIRLECDSKVAKQMNA